MKTKKGDFLEFDYIAKISNTDQVFDLTKEEEAKKFKIYNKDITYKPIKICQGQQFVIPGLDEALPNKEVNKTFTINIPAEKAFGKKENKLIKIIPLKKFKDQKITPFPGLQVNIDNQIGIVRSVSSGRVIVDFNHPLADKAVTYEVTIKKIITDIKEKADVILSIINFPIETNLKDNKLIIKNIPDVLQKPIEDKLKSLIPELKEIEFNNSKTTTKE